MCANRGLTLTASNFGVKKKSGRLFKTKQETRAVGMLELASVCMYTSRVLRGYPENTHTPHAHTTVASWFRTASSFPVNTPISSPRAKFTDTESVMEWRQVFCPTVSMVIVCGRSAAQRSLLSLPWQSTCRWHKQRPALHHIAAY